MDIFDKFKYRNEKPTRTNDRGGVHLNSGIPNHAFYLFATSLKEPAWETAGRIWYKTITSGSIKPNCTIPEFAAATLTVAKTLTTDQQTALRQAWVTVRVIK